MAFLGAMGPRSRSALTRAHKPPRPLLLSPQKRVITETKSECDVSREVFGGKEEEEAAGFFSLMFMVMLMSYLVWNILAENGLFYMFKILLNSTLA